MAVPNVPFWLSQANTEFQANGWGSNILSKAGLGTTGLLGQLAGMARLQKIASIQSVVTGNNTPPDATFSYNASTNQTIYTYIDGTTVKSYPIFNGRAWVRIRNGGITYVNCTEARWYQVDGVQRGVLNPNKGTVRSQTYEFAATEGGTIVYTVTAALNFI
ncbi:hypothetical protein KNT91_gp193 [Aeromonas phage 60AhydR15PP]|uniref:Uncharacterized protein n=1 Tax=Aeromonas phage 60AhydR15PP TaxID=2163979 RepID=A0A2S1PGM8_9CAUD|nr:hypothetical protein KNT91_gp193 [Aeromonas phage 60AhydR15PP]AWH15717.1 hypothetical protein [Aeromonas phage 60AhydR15PP]